MKHFAFRYLTDKRVVALALLLAIQFVSGLHLGTNALAQEVPVLISDADEAQSRFIGILCDVMGWMFSILLILSVVVVLAAAYVYVTAGGSAEKVKSGTRMITYAVIGIVVAMFARGVPLIVASLLGATTVGEVCAGGSVVTGVPNTSGIPITYPDYFWLPP